MPKMYISNKNRVSRIFHPVKRIRIYEKERQVFVTCCGLVVEEKDWETHYVLGHSYLCSNCTATAAYAELDTPDVAHMVSKPNKPISEEVDAYGGGMLIVLLKDDGGYRCKNLDGVLKFLRQKYNSDMAILEDLEKGVIRVHRLTPISIEPMIRTETIKHITTLEELD